MTVLRPLVSLLSVLSLCLTLLSAPAYADDAKNKDILTMLKISGQLEASEQVISVMVPQLIQLIKSVNPELPEADLKMIMTQLELDLKKEVPELLKSLVPVYDKHFTHADIKALIAFYESPVGKKFVTKQTLVIPESMKIGEAWGQQVAQKALKSAMGKLKK